MVDEIGLELLQYSYEYCTCIFVTHGLPYRTKIASTVRISRKHDVSPLGRSVVVRHMTVV